uniref:CUB_2 domain-containing protein n=1 Tax=Caenorhabditis tropicalis TaxID=1561998 RepID=A0A1I7T105_9PELO
MNFIIFLIIISIGSVSSSGYTCPGPGAMKFNPPDDLNKPLYWPSIWNDSMPPIPFASQQLCTWEIEIPNGLYASVIFYKNAPSDVSISVTYPDGSMEGLDNNDFYPYIFTSPKFSITLYKSKNGGAFSFKVSWSKYPEVKHDSIQLQKETKPTSMIPNGTTFIAETTVSLVGFGLKNQSHYPLLRQSAVFDGDSTNGKFIGTLYRIMMSKKEKVSSGKSLTVYTWGLEQQFDYVLYMVQDRTNEQNFFSYRGENCDPNYDCSYVINAVYGVSVLVTSDDHSEFIKSIGSFPDGATLKIYEGSISDETLVTKLTKDNYKSRLPMELKNTIRQYVLDTGVINGFTITKDSTNGN